MFRAITREPHITVRRTSTKFADDDASMVWGTWAYSVVVGNRKHTGTCGDVSFGEVWREVRRVMRRPSKYTWVQLTDDERRAYGRPVSQSEPPRPPAPPSES